MSNSRVNPSLIYFFMIVGVVVPLVVNGYAVQELDIQADGSFVLHPAKVELTIPRGEEKFQDLTITNKIGSTQVFTLSVEDFTVGSGEEIIQLLGDTVGPYSLRSYVFPEISEVTLQNGEQAIIPVSVRIPVGATARGLYGSVVVSAESPEESGVQVHSRLGSLFFVRVDGEVKEHGQVTAFKPLYPENRGSYITGPAQLEIVFQNTGNVHLLPQGKIQVQDMLGRRTEILVVDPWFVLPGSTRSKEVTSFLPRLGRYTATLTLEKGYESRVFEETISFWVIPWKKLIFVEIGLLLFIWLVWWIKSFKKKNERKK